MFTKRFSALWLKGLAHDCGLLHHGILVCALIFALAGVPRAQDDLVTSDSARGVHDPVLIRQGNTYYLFYTSGRGGTDMRASTDLTNWTRTGKAFKEIPEWTRQMIPGVGNLWAPDISFHNGKYFLYYSASQFGKNNSCIGLMTNPTLDPADPKYKWTDEGVIIRSQQGKDAYNCIDPNAVYDQDGGMWLVFGSFFSGIHMFKLAPATGKPAENPPHLITVACTRDSAKKSSRLDAPLPPDNQGIEAPFIVYHDGYYYLFCSYDLCCRGLRSNYKMGVGRSRSVQGPYVDRQGLEMVKGAYTPVLKGTPPVIGPGHCGLLMNDNGVDWLAHHFYDGRRRGQSALQVRPMIWTADGWPMVGLPYAGPTQKISPSRQNLAGRWMCSVDFNAAQPLTLDADGSTSLGLARGSWDVAGRQIKLASGAEEKPAALTLAPDGRFFAGFNAAGKVVRAWRSAEHQ